MSCEPISMRLFRHRLGSIDRIPVVVFCYSISTLQYHDATPEFFLVIQTFVDYSVRLEGLIFKEYGS